MPGRILLDACVLYPTVMREMLIGVAGKGAFTPLWSPRILEEWARAARKIGPTGEAQARSEIALLKIRWGFLIVYLKSIKCSFFIKAILIC